MWPLSFSWFCLLSCCLVNNGLPGCVGGFWGGLVVGARVLGLFWCVSFCLVRVCPVLVGAGRGRGVPSVGLLVVVLLVGECASGCFWWWVWLFGCGRVFVGWRVRVGVSGGGCGCLGVGVCCPGWRVACVASWRCCSGWCECGG